MSVDWADWSSKRPLRVVRGYINSVALGVAQRICEISKITGLTAPKEGLLLQGHARNGP